ncbi:hypothetical protein ACFLWS_03660 [Chloroflexota bacterium]
MLIPTSFVSNKSQNRLAIFKPLGGRNFRPLLLGEFICLLGTQIHLIVLAWLALHYTIIVKLLKSKSGRQLYLNSREFVNVNKGAFDS